VPIEAAAEIILDDFDESFEIVLPDMEDEFVVQAGVGTLSAERRSQFNASSGSQPTGGIDADLSQISSLTFEIVRLNPHPLGGAPAIALNLSYQFVETDITQSGRNDRVVVDFTYLRSAIPMARVDVFIQDASQPGISYVSQHFSIPTGEDAFSLEFPFNSFGVRGGGSGMIDYQQVYHVSLSVSPTRFTDIDQIDFSTAVERIRFTNAVPEPPADLIVCLAVTSGILFYFRRRRMEQCAVGQLFRCWQGFYLLSRLCVVMRNRS
jgi:hypothetical protein